MIRAVDLWAAFTGSLLDVVLQGAEEKFQALAPQERAAWEAAAAVQAVPVQPAPVRGKL